MRQLRDQPVPRRLPAAFLDRDGVINVDHGYTFRPGDLVFTPTAVEGIGLLNRSGYRTIVVTNQSGIARGFYTESDVVHFHDVMQQRLAATGAWIDAFYFCGFHPDGSVAAFAMDHEDRKPKPGMLLRAMREWPTDVAASMMVGDKASDMEAAAQAGITGLLMKPNVGDLAALVRGFLARASAACW